MKDLLTLVMPEAQPQRSSVVSRFSWMMRRNSGRFRKTMDRYGCDVSRCAMLEQTNWFVIIKNIHSIQTVSRVCNLLVWETIQVPKVRGSNKRRHWRRHDLIQTQTLFHPASSYVHCRHVPYFTSSLANTKGETLVILHTYVAGLIGYGIEK